MEFSQVAIIERDLGGFSKQKQMGITILKLSYSNTVSDEFNVVEQSTWNLSVVRVVMGRSRWTLSTACYLLVKGNRILLDSRSTLFECPHSSWVPPGGTWKADLGRSTPFSDCLLLYTVYLPRISSVRVCYVHNSPLWGPWNGFLVFCWLRNVIQIPVSIGLVIHIVDGTIGGNFTVSWFDISYRLCIFPVHGFRNQCSSKVLRMSFAFGTDLDSIRGWRKIWFALPIPRQFINNDSFLWKGQCIISWPLECKTEAWCPEKEFYSAWSWISRVTSNR